MGHGRVVESHRHPVPDADAHLWQQQFEAVWPMASPPLMTACLTITPGVGLALSSDSTVYSLL